MIGGGTLSLPLAFAQGGTFGGVLILLFVASSAYGSIMNLIDCSIVTTAPGSVSGNLTRGSGSYEGVVSTAPLFKNRNLSQFVRYFCMGW